MRDRAPQSFASAKNDGATVAVFVCLWLILDRTAALLGSTRGEYGFAVCAAVLAAAAAGEYVLAGRRPIPACRVLGLGRPRISPLGVTALLTGMLLCFYPAFSFATGAPLTLRPDAAWLALGMFAQGGIAEEIVFRGFLFRRFREGRTFWRAAALSAVPFTAVHLLLFLTLDFPLALASLVLAVSMSFPLAWLFETSGGTIWPSAILHAAVQASIKLVETGDAFFPTLAVGWIAIGVVAPWILFALARPPPQRENERK
jgi:membrane protease YdiL (CAAX protease family)